MRSVRPVAGLVVLIALSLASSPALAGDPRWHDFETLQLSDVFFGEGANHGDFDRDGTEDIVSGPYWYRGPDFEERHAYYPPEPFDKNGYSDHFFSWTDDFNGDGWDDILVVGFPGKDAAWYENPRGEDGHWTRHLAIRGVDNESPHYVDLTGDGRRELVFHLDGRWGWAAPDPDRPDEPWTFTPISPKGPWQRYTHGMGVGDVNGDGRADILHARGWWEQPAEPAEGDWPHHDVDFAPGGYGGAQMFAYDFDGDGDNDVAAAPRAHGYGLYWFENLAGDDGPRFEARAIMDPEQGADPKANRYGVAFSQPHAMDLVDMDGDGVKDLVTGKRYWAHNGHDIGARGQPVLYWFKTHRTDHGLRFVPFLIHGASGVGTQVVAGDINGDGLPDVVVGNKAGTFVHLHQPPELDGAAPEEALPRPLPAALALRARERPSDPGVVPEGEDGEPLNLGFETGTLEDWTAEGDAFAGMPVQGDATLRERRDQASNREGDYWIGGYELDGDEPQGTLTSVPFEVTHPWASFLLGGGHHTATFVEVVRAGSGELLLRASGQDAEPMTRTVVDLREHRGEPIRVRLVDRHSGHWGHVNFDDFRFHDRRPVPSPGEAPLQQDVYPHAGLSPERAAEAMTLPAGFDATVFAAEPDVRQPIAFTIDAKGRLWVAEAYSYPRRRPEDEAKDRILIFDDEDGDGRFDTRKVFYEGLNLVSGLEVGFGGVWVGAAPQLLFIPDRDGDDVPDGEPEVHLDGWGTQDTHETLNAFIWGPDGWLYGCHGVFTHSNVGKPGAPDAERKRINAGIWRYHPLRREFEVYCRGTSNPWGIDWNDRGQAFLTACVIPHLFHVVQGARYRRQAGRHFDPHVYDDIKTIGDHVHYLGPTPHSGNNRSDAAGGGHAHCGAMLYLGDAWPQSYRNRIFMNNIHGQRVNVDVLARRGSGYVGHHDHDFLLTHDRWSQGINLKYGPDGQVYLIDWYDQNACHRREIDAHDRSNGRIYKITWGEPSKERVDLSEASDVRLAELQLHANEWHVRSARRLLQERAARRGLQPEAVAALRRIALEHPREERRLRGLWALHVTSRLTEPVAQRALRDPSPFVRGWAIQLILEDRRYTGASRERFVEMAGEDPSQLVRLYLASALQRMPLEDRWDVAAGLVAHAGDAGDHNLPLMYWYGIEPLADDDAARALELAAGSEIPLLLSYMVRRIGSQGTPESLALLVGGLGATEDPDRRLIVLEGIRKALEGRRRVPMPETWPAVAEKLEQAEDERVRESARSLAVTFGDPRALKVLRERLVDSGAEPAERRSALETLVAAKAEGLAPALHSLLDEPELREDAIRALATYDDPDTSTALIEVYDDLSLSVRRDALNTLASRPEWARSLLHAVDSGRIPASHLSAALIRQLRNLGDEGVDELVAEVWGTVRDVAEDKARLIEETKELVADEDRPEPDLPLGRAVFARTCQQCHTLFGTGGEVGPDLTGSNRADLDYILSNILDPSAVLADEYLPWVFVTADGRVVTGLVMAETANAWTVRTANESVVLPKAEVIRREQSDQSMMPEDLLAPLDDHEVRSLIAYLAGSQQTPMLATPENASSLFNGRDLTGWNGNEDLWSVEDGQIVGRSPGLDHNEFLWSDLLAGDFRLRFEVKLEPDSGNSGVQFRSEPLPDGEVKGYQADIGRGWWGKLYEERGRGLLWEESGEENVRPGEWNRYEIVAVGPRIRTWINGGLCVDLDDPEGARRGVFALQLHSGPAMTVRYRNLRLEVDPKIAPDG